MKLMTNRSGFPKGILVAFLICSGISPRAAIADEPSLSSKNISKQADSVRDKLLGTWLWEQVVILGVSGSRSKEEHELISKIRAQLSNQSQPSCAELWELFDIRMAEKRYDDANACLNLIHCLVDPADSVNRKRLITETKRLSHESNIPKSTGKVMKGYICSSDTAAEGAGNDDGANVIRTFPRKLLIMPGYTGLWIIDGVVDGTVKYSPAFRQADIHPGDRVIAIDGIEIKGLSNSYIKALLTGAPGTSAVVRIKRNDWEKEVRIQRECLPEKLPAGLTARQYFELGVQIRDARGSDLAKVALAKAVELDPQGTVGELAQKALLARFPRYQAPDDANRLNSIAYRMSKDHQYAQAEKLFQECIARWPQFEWPYKNLSTQYLMEKRYSDAARVAEDLLKINPYYARGWGILADAKLALGDRAGAEECKKRKKELDPDDYRD